MAEQATTNLTIKAESLEEEWGFADNSPDEDSTLDEDTIEDIKEQKKAEVADTDTKLEYQLQKVLRKTVHLYDNELSVLYLYTSLRDLIKSILRNNHIYTIPFQNFDVTREENKLMRRLEKIKTKTLYMDTLKVLESKKIDELELRLASEAIYKDLIEAHGDRDLLKIIAPELMCILLRHYGRFVKTLS